MQVRVLGELQVLLGGVPVDLGGPKPRALLALLVAAEGRPVRVQHLVEEIWGEDPPARVEASLQSYVARLRRELDPGRVTRSPTERLRTHPGAYSLHADDVDVRRFAELLRRARDAARTGRPETTETLLVEALALWQGDPYPGLGDCPSLAAEATRLEELRLAAVEDLWEIRVRHGDPTAAVAELGRLVRLHPTRERSWATLALAQYRSARQGDALDTLRRARAHLVRELGVDPGPELQALEQAVLQQDPTLLPPPHPRPAADPPVRSAPAAARLVGRQADLEACERVLTEAARGRGRVVVVSGEAGIGKTRFVDAVVDRATSAAFRTGRGGWEPDGCPALWGWNRAVRSLLCREGVLSSDGSGLDAASESYRLAELLLAELSGGPPSVLVLDDVHWADPDSLRLLRRLAADLAGVPTVLVVALRDGHPPADGSVADLLASLARFDPLRVQLTGLAPQEVMTYVRQDAHVEIDLPVATALFERTDGNPFYLTELVRLLAAEDALSRPDAPGWQVVPRGVRDVVRQRLGQVPEAARPVLAVAAVTGRSFALPVVQAASGLSPREVDDALEAALASGLVQPGGPAEYRFSHALTRDAVYDGVPAPLRARLHAGVAAALEEHHAGSVASHAAELAEHHRLAGPTNARPGWLFARRAAGAAAARSAHDEARRLWEQAAQLQQRDPLATDVEREAVQVGLARALRGLARPVEAWPPLAEAARSALARGDAPTALRTLLEVTVGAVWGWRARPQVDAEAIALWRTTLDAVDADTPAPLRARAEAALAVEHLYAPGSSTLCRRLADGAVARVRRGAGPRETLEVLQLASLSSSRADLLHRREELVEEVLALASTLSDHTALAVGLVQRAAVRGDTGRLDAAHSDLVRAQQLAEQHHLGQVLVVAGWGLALVRQAHGDLDVVEAEAERLERLEETLALPSAGVGLAQLVGVRMRQGRLAELEPALRAAAVHVPTAMRDLHALALVCGGGAERARLLLGPWPEQPPLVDDYLWTTLTVVRAELWLALGDPQAVRELHRALHPYAGTVATGGMSSLFLGAVDHTLGRLAAADGDLVAAAAHLQEAQRLHESMGLPWWADRSRRLLTELTSGGGGAVDGDGPSAEGPA